MSDLNTEIKIGADASGVEAGVGKAKRSLKDLGDAAQKAGKDAGAGMASVGAGGDKAAKDVERATKTMQGALQRLLAEQKSGAKGSREYYEALADTRGISRNAIKPILDQIDAAKTKTLQAKAAADSWQSSFSKIGPAVAVAFSGAAITAFLGKVVSVQREFDVLNSSLKTVTGSSAAAEREMAWLKDFAKETPFGLAQATQGFVKMKALGLDPTRAALTSFGNTASAMGKDLNQMIEAVADASTGEFERLKEFGITAKKEGDQVSLTFQGVTTTIGNSAREITKYLEDIGNTSFGGAMEERAKTLDGTIAALGDTWDELFRTVSTNNVGGLIFDTVTLANGALEDATTILKAMGGAAQEAGKGTGALVTIQDGLATVFETVAVVGANVKYVLTQVGNEVGGLAAQVAQAAQFNFSGVAAIRTQMVADAQAARREIDATTARILNARKEQERYASFATRNASAALDPRRVDLPGTGRPTPRPTGGSSAAKEQISEYDKLIQRLGVDLPKAAAEAEAAQMGYNKSQTEFLALAGSPAWASFSNAQRAVVASMFEGKIASEEAGESAKALSKAYAEAAAERLKTIQSMERAADSLQSQNDALREEIELIGLSTEQQTLVLQQRNDVIILTKEATLAELERQSAVTGTQTRVEIALASEIEALKERNALLGAKGAKNAAVDAAKTAKDEWQKTSDKINDTLTDALMRGFESGKDFAKNLRDTVVNMFSTLVLRPVISAVLSPISGALGGVLGGGAGAAGGNNPIGMASNAYSLYNTGSQAWTLGSQYLSGSMSGANALGSVYANATGGGLDALLATNGAYGTAGGGSGFAAAAAPAAAAAAVAAVVLNALGAFKSERKVGGGLMGTLGSGDISPWEEWREGGTLFSGPSYSTFNPIAELDKAREEEKQLRVTGADSGRIATQQVVARNLEDQYGGLAEATAAQSKVIQSAFDAMRKSAGDMADVLGLSSEAARNFTTALGGEKGLALDGLKPEEQQAKLAEALATANNEIAQQLIGTWETTTTEINRIVSENLGSAGEDASIVYSTLTDSISKTRYVASEYAKEGEKAIDTLTRLATSFATVKDLWADMRVDFDATGLAGADAASKIADAFGGLEPMTQQLAGYIENFYSETEKRENLARRSSGVLQSVGLNVSQEDVLGSSRIAVRGFVEDVLAKFGPSSPQYVTAVQQANALAGLYEPLGAAAAAAADVMGEAMKRLQSDSASLQIDLLRAQGNGTGADAAQRTLDTTGLSDAEIAIYDYNQSLRAQIGALNDAAQATADQASIRADFERQLLQLQGDTAALRLLDIAGMDAANVALYDRVQALTASQAAEQAAAQAAQAAAQAAQAAAQAAQAAAQAALQAEQELAAKREQVAQQAYGIETQLLQLQGNTAALRARELAALDPANRADQLRVYAMTDAQAATKAAADAERDLAATRVQSAQDAYRAAQESTGSAFDAVSRSVNAERAIYESARTAAADAAQEIKSVIDTLTGSIKDLYAGVDSTRQASATEGASFITAALRAARSTGYLPDATGLSDAITAARGGLGAQNFATQFEADRAQLVIAGQLSELSDIAKPQLTAAERTLRNAENQLKTLDDILKNAQSQVDAARGISTTVGTIPAALAGLQSALLSEAQAKALAQSTTAPSATAPAAAPKASGLSGPYAAMVESALKSAAYTADDRLVYDTARMFNVTSSELDKLMGWTAGTSLEWAKKNKLPEFAVGTNYVPQDMAAIVHKGEMIVPAAYNPATSGAASNNAEVVAELRALRNQNERMEARLASIEGSNTTMANLLDEVTEGGNAMRSEVMA